MFLPPLTTRETVERDTPAAAATSIKFIKFSHLEDFMCTMQQKLSVSDPVSLHYACTIQFLISPN
jgi:hypothetical protein